jgi:hypothetical protein
MRTAEFRADERIRQLHRIVDSDQWELIDREPVTPGEAEQILALFHRLSSPTREAFARLKVRDMSQIAHLKMVEFERSREARER